MSEGESVFTKTNIGCLTLLGGVSYAAISLLNKYKVQAEITQSQTLNQQNTDNSIREFGTNPASHASR